eukprot:5809592-Heterocapsa_arctica.AAC.1
MAAEAGTNDAIDSSVPSGSSGADRAPPMDFVPVVALDETPGPTTVPPPDPDDDDGGEGGGNDGDDDEDEPTPDADPYADPRVKKVTCRAMLCALLDQHLRQIVLLKGCPSCE